MANEVGVGIPGGGVLAVLPLRTEETGIPEDIAQGIEETFAEQIQAGKPGLKIKTRRDFRKIWDETAPISRSRLEDELRGMEVDYLVVPTALPFPEGIEVSFRAYDIREGAGSRLIGASRCRGTCGSHRRRSWRFRPNRPPLSPPAGCTRRSDAGSERAPGGSRCGPGARRPRSSTIFPAW